MTPEDQQILHKIHDALFEVPAGSGPDEKPLIELIRIVVRSYQRASWATRAIVWLLPAIAGLGVAYQTIVGWLK